MSLQVLIAPLSDLLRVLLESFWGLTGSYGWAILLLSLSVSIIMLPLFLLADRIQQRDSRDKAAMAAELDYIRTTVPSSQERYFYTRYVYRRHGYHPIKSLRSLLGLAVQVPFFIAAYQMLGHYTPLDGQSFGPIADLGQPDGLLFSHWNLLPILMTLANILSAWVFLQDGQHQKHSGHTQLFGLALLFLLLLYRQNAALVLYWTGNNLFSLLKNSLKNWRYLRDYGVFRREIFWPLLLWSGACGAAFTLSFFLFSRIGYGLGSWGAISTAQVLQGLSFAIAAILVGWSLSAPPSSRGSFFLCRGSQLLYLALLGFIACQALLVVTEGRAHWYRYSKELAIMIVAVWLALLGCQFWLLYRCWHPKQSSRRIYSVLLHSLVWPALWLSILYLGLQNRTPSELSLHYSAVPAVQLLSGLVVLLFGLVLFHSWPQLPCSRRHLACFFWLLAAFCGAMILLLELRLFVLLFAAAQQFCLLLLRVQLRKAQLTQQLLRTPKWKSLRTLLFLSAMLLAYLIYFVENPILVYLSDAQEFSYTAQEIVAFTALFGLVLAALVVAAYAVRRLRCFLLYLAVIVALSSWVYSYVYLPYIGKMQGLRFEELGYLYRSFSSNLFELAVFGTACGGALWLLQKRPQYLLLLNAIGLLVIATKGVSDYRRSSAEMGVESLATAGSPAESTDSADSLLRLLPAGYRQNLAFSKEQPNILVVLFDGFTGPLVPKIFREYPEIAQQYRGFVHYRNALTAAAPTFGSLLSMLAGKDYEPKPFGQRMQADGLSTRSSYDWAYNFLPELLERQGFQVYHHLNFDFAERSAMSFATGGDSDYLAYWQRRYGIEEVRPPRSFTLNLVLRLAIFKGVPLFLKPAIYNNGDWLGLERWQIASTGDRQLVAGQRAYRTAGRRLALLQSFAELANTEAADKTYKFIHLQPSHGPFSVDKDLRYRLLAANYEELNDFPYAYYSLVYTLRAFGQWLQWLRQHGVYDNTKIILTSDHGWWLSTGQSKYNPQISSWDSVKTPADKDLYLEQGIVTSLLMVKDFGSSPNSDTQIQYSDKPMISSDLPYLTTPDIPGAEQVYRQIAGLRRDFDYTFVNSSGDYTAWNFGLRYEIRYDTQTNRLYYREKNRGDWRILLSYNGLGE